MISRVGPGTHLAYEPEHAVDLDTGAIVAQDAQADHVGPGRLRPAAQPHAPSRVIVMACTEPLQALGDGNYGGTLIGVPREDVPHDGGLGFIHPHARQLPET
jgi:hypothetical protein